MMFSMAGFDLWVADTFGTIFWSILIYIIGGFTMKPLWNHVLVPLGKWMARKVGALTE